MSPQAFNDRGIVPSEVHWGDERLQDHNGFVTALAIRALRQHRQPIPESMLRVLELCRTCPNGFGFWPEGETPTWAPQLPSDSDDTAIMALELLCAQRLGIVEVRRIACLGIARHRIAILPTLRPPWLRKGVFATWHRAGPCRDMVDCTALTNVLALLASIGLEDLPGATESRALLHDAITWAGDDPLRARSVSPFYPDPGEWVLALEHATQQNARDMRPLWEAAKETNWGKGAWARATQAGHTVCSSPYGGITWHSTHLSAIRQHAFCEAPTSKKSTPQSAGLHTHFWMRINA